MGLLFSVHLHSQVLAKGSLQANQTPPTFTCCPQRQVSQSLGLADNSQQWAQNAVLVDGCPSSPPPHSWACWSKLEGGADCQEAGPAGKMRRGPAAYPARCVLW